MSLEASILELAKAITALAQAFPTNGAFAPQSVTEVTPEKPAKPIKVRATKVTEAEINAAAAETETAARAAEIEVEVKPTPPEKQIEVRAEPEKPAEGPTNYDEIREQVRALIYKVDDQLGRAAALAVLKKVGVTTVTGTTDAALQTLLSAANEALELA